MGLARLDDRRARPGEAVNGGALVRRSSRPLTAPTGFAKWKMPVNFIRKIIAHLHP